MSLGGWTVEDSAEHRERITWADARIWAWARWQGSDNPAKLGYPACSSFGNAIKPQSDEAQAGARHVRSDVSCTDDEAMEVDAVIADWKVHHRLWFRLVRREYFGAGPVEKKSRELGMGVREYRRQLDRLRLAMQRELQSVTARCTIRDEVARATHKTRP